MRNFYSKYKYILFFFLFLALSQFTHKLSYVPEQKKADISGFNSKLIEKEKLTDYWLDSILEHAESKNFKNWINHNYSVLDWLHKEKGITFYIYKNNFLKYWTNNSHTIPNDTLWSDKPFIKLSNIYVDVRKTSKDSITIIGLISIKNNYPFENMFLENRFHHSFNLKESLSLFIETNPSKEAVFNSNGEYLFSIKKITQNKTETSQQFALFLIAIAIIMLILAARSFFLVNNLSKKHFIVFAVLVISVRLLMQLLQFPNPLYSLEIFKPQYLAFSIFFPSIGELLITAAIVIYLIFVFYTKVSISSFVNISSLTNKLKITLWFLIFSGYSIFFYYIFNHLIIDSNFQYEAYDVLNLSVFSFLGYLIIAILFSGLILLFDKACIQLRKSISYTLFSLFIILFGLVITVISIVINHYEYLITISFFIAILLYWSFIRFKKTLGFSSFVIVVAIFSAFATYFIRVKNFNKRIEESKVLAVNLAREQDPVAEVILSDIIKNLPNDTTVANFLMQEYFNYDEFRSYLNQNYFTGYLGRYLFQLTICNKYDSLLVENEEVKTYYCFDFFESLLKEYGIETDVTGLYYLKTNHGGSNYFLQTEIPLSNNWDDVILYFELSSKPNFEVLGYPELLLEKPIGLYQAQSNANYAKYVNDELINTTGDFPYALHRSFYEHDSTEFSFFQLEEYDHLLYNADKDNALIISYPTVDFYNILISFTYIFLFLLIQVTILLVIVNPLTNLIEINFNIKNKIIYSMVIILFMSLLIVSASTVFYTYRQFDNNQFNLLSEKIQSVLVELEHKLSHTQEIHEIDKEYVNGLLVKFSNVFYSDINLYDLDGNLVATSRSEIFDKNLTSSKINSNAFRELILNKKARIVQKETIGKLDYYSAYIPFTSSDNRLLAYLNLPYFSKEVVLRQELMKVVVAIINIYAFLIIISIGLAVYISNKLTQPLRMVQQRIRNINLSKENERIAYSGNDEIAELVFEYNKMLEELDKSAKLLAKSERESAWREMARQIAHEIKNPLTPMKLSVQLLQRSWENNDSDFEERFKRSSHTLIQQIDSLSSIATAFSQFARMPIAQMGKVNIIERAERSAELYREIASAEIKIIEPDTRELFVKADKERLLQVFNNLIKNATQAVSKEKDGLITISFNKTSESIVVKINDNGIGIPEFMFDKLFEPNFTTKSSGTGLGLAIVKNIIEEIGGAIWFESSEKKGTSFYVSMPLFT